MNTGQARSRLRSVILHRLCRCLVVLGSLFCGAVGSLLVARYLVVPILLSARPDLDGYLADWGVYGAFPVRTYVTFNLTSPRTNIIQWDKSCEGGVVLLALDGPSISHPGPMILDAEGDLIWTSDAFGEAANLDVQRYRGQDFLTFWSGEKQPESGQGRYYMLDSSYNVVHTISAVGKGLDGDLHEFRITANNTALITIFDQIDVDLGQTEVKWIGDPVIIDGILQEVDIATRDLVFEWRAADYLDFDALNNTFQRHEAYGVFDYFHINSVDKGSDGNYLVSLRHLHTVVCVDGKTGDVIWALGGETTDFRDLSDGAATDFQWQHNVRWISEDEGILGLFDNGIARNHYSDADYSRGIVIQLDFIDRTAKLLHSYVSMDEISSASMGSLQVSPSAGPDANHVFVGWGSAGAYSEFDMDGELLCETHFAASSLFYWERAKSYRANKAAGWQAEPAGWDPVARVKGNQIFVSWNGATTVASWTLELLSAATAEEGGGDQEHFVELNIVDKQGFETSFELPDNDTRHRVFRIGALDADKKVLRYSNVVVRPESVIMQYTLLLALLATITTVLVVLTFRHRHCLRNMLSNNQVGASNTKYHRLESAIPLVPQLRRSSESSECG